VYQVWSFSPPPEVEDYHRGGSPMSMLDHPMLDDFEKDDKARLTDGDSIMEDSDAYEGQ
jgi:hypothetical protein